MSIELAFHGSCVPKKLERIHWGRTEVAVSFPAAFISLRQPFGPHEMVNRKSENMGVFFFFAGASRTSRVLIRSRFLDPRNHGIPVDKAREKN